MTDFDNQYHNLLTDILDNGTEKTNRTGTNTISRHGAYMRINTTHEFPILTTKRCNWRASITEMIGFIRAYDNANDFRTLGTRIWDKNANETTAWLNNPNRIGTDDLGRIYGVQARSWRNPDNTHTDQLKNTINKILNHTDDRRLLVNHWNPGEINQMALPPCHTHYQFHINPHKRTLDLSFYMRSNDVFLGLPFNIMGYAFLLRLVSEITNYTPGDVIYHGGDVHLYTNHLEQVQTQLHRKPIQCNPELIIKTNDLNYVETTTDPISTWIELINYDAHPPLSAPMAV